MTRPVRMPQEIIRSISDARGDWEKLLKIAGELAELQYLDLAEELCYAVLLNNDKSRSNNKAVKTIEKVSELRQRTIYPKHYILR